MISLLVKSPKLTNHYSDNNILELKISQISNTYLKKINSEIKEIGNTHQISGHSGQKRRKNKHQILIKDCNKYPSRIIFEIRTGVKFLIEMH